MNMKYNNFEMAISPASSGEAYYSYVMSLPVLTKEEEKELAQDLLDNNNLDSAKKLIMHNLRFVIYIAKGYSGYGLNVNDLVQEGNIGLMKAVKKFDPSKNVRLITFAVHWIKSEINEFVIKNWKIVKVATTKAQRKLFFNLRSKKKSSTWLNNDEAKSIALDLGVSEKDVKEMESRLSNYDLAVESESDDENSFGPIDYLESSELQPDVVVELEDKTKYYEALKLALNNLDDRSKEIISTRWLTDNKSTLAELSEKYGISQERVRQIESESIKALKKYIKV